MHIRFYIDSDTKLPHIYKHNVKKHEVEEILEKPGEDRPGRDNSRVAIGQTCSGKILRVIYVPDSTPDSVFVVTAYPLTGKPLKSYKARRRLK